MTAPFQALLRDLKAVLGRDATAFLDDPGARRSAHTSVLTLGPNHAQAEGSADAEAEAYHIKKTAFDVVLDSSAMCWFFFEEPRYLGGIPKYGRMPEELPTIWDEPGLLPPGMKERAAVREIRQTDSYAMEDRVWRQWALFVTPGEIGYENLLRASARLWYGPSGDPGPFLKGDLFCLQPGVPMIVLPIVLDGACALLARDASAFAPLLPVFRVWMTSAAGVETPKTEAVATPEIARPATPKVKPPAWTDPDPDYEWKLWYEDLFDRDTPRSVDKSGRGLVPALTALWARHLREGGLSRFNLFGGGKSIQIEGDREGTRKLRLWIYGDRTAIPGGYHEAGDLDLLEKIANCHALNISGDPSATALCTLAKQSDDRFVFERLLDDWIEQGPASR